DRDHEDAPWAEGAAGRRMRALLAAADEDDYAEAVERLAEHRREPMQKLVVSYLVPTRQDWVEECLALPWLSLNGRRLLWCAVGSAEQVGRRGRRGPVLGSLGPYEEYEPEYGFLRGMLATVVESVGPAIAPKVAEAIRFESERYEPDVRIRKVFLD